MLNIPIRLLFYGLLASLLISALHSRQFVNAIPKRIARLARRSKIARHPARPVTCASGLLRLGVNPHFPDEVAILSALFPILI
jgi:hypothetical protein